MVSSSSRMFRGWAAPLLLLLPLWASAQHSGTLVINVGPIDGSFAPCETGYFRSSPEVNAPCKPCLTCSWNAQPLVECVTRVADPLQCQCNDGYFPNMRGGCLPIRPGEPVPTAAVLPAPVPTMAAQPAPVPTMAVEPAPLPTNLIMPTPLPGVMVPAPVPDVMVPAPVPAPTMAVQPAPVSVPPPPVAAPESVGGGDLGGGGTLVINVGPIDGSFAPCQPGYFRSSPEVNAPCVPCLTCSWNSRPIVECVTRVADPNQCQCIDGYFPNMRFGCLEIRPGVPVPTMAGQPAPVPVPPPPVAAPVPVSGASLVINVGPIDGSFAPCEPGYFRSSPEVNAPCVPCLTCSWNSRPIVECVTRVADPNQCQCNEGYFPNMRGGCLEIRPGVPIPTMAVQPAPVPMTTATAPTNLIMPAPVPGVMDPAPVPGVMVLAPVPDVMVPAPVPGAMMPAPMTAPVPGQFMVPGGSDPVAGPPPFSGANFPQMMPVMPPTNHSPSVVHVDKGPVTPPGIGLPLGGIGPTDGPNDPPCGFGQCRTAPGLPCGQRQSCGPNGVPLALCVQNNADPNQCRCNSGFTPNGSGACVADGQMEQGGSTANCPAGQFERRSGDGCIPCKTCPWNAEPIVTCVMQEGDPAQCQCRDGFTSNGRGGCRAVSGHGAGTTTMMASVDSSGAASTSMIGMAVATCAIATFFLQLF
jgi:hypothetical protein